MTNAIEYWKPVGTAWQRMVDILFRPFQIEKWMVMGFAAFIAGANLGGSGGSGSGNSGSSGDSLTSCDWSFPDFWSEYGSLIITVGAAVVALVFVLWIVFLWLHARGHFIFLDNVLTNRGAIVQPWKRYRKQGNSLFQWNLAVTLIALLILIVLIGICLVMVWPMFAEKQHIPMGVTGLVLGIFSLLIYCLCFGYLTVFVHDFVTPLMLKHDLRIRSAWGLFGPLLKENIGKFLLYGLVRYLVLIGVNMAYLALCLATCCCFLILTMIPYIGTVLLLPAHVFVRLLGPEFLQQFGDDFIIGTAPSEEDCMSADSSTAPEAETI